ncbi:type I secretion system permease/ATPase [Methylobacterium sp. Leaf113]|uniref:type I secretion system permease/ATPase n=1 Tax=Methylobacterium sp. Leaf113 TaxID=1736259 RepID=UPI0009EA1AB0|nr:type I secretion system permease/ATPase [Methylobacterium sp. Leaf113]
MHKASDTPEITAAISKCRLAFLFVAITSGLINILYLTASFFMLEVYDRVIPSRSIPTLVGLGLLALVLYAFQGLFETLRTRILGRISGAVDEAIAHRVFDVVARAPLRGPSDHDGSLPMRDFDQVRSFLAGPGPSAFFDLPWMPVYIVICSLFHPLIGVAAIVGLVILFLLTLLSDWTTSRKIKSSVHYGSRRYLLAEAGRRNAEVLAAMGMRRRFGARWAHVNREYMDIQQNVSDLGGGVASLTKVFRMSLQSGVLALGAFLVINNQATGGVIIASSILVARALAPAEMVIGNWKSFIQARQSWKRLSDALALNAPEKDLQVLPAPTQTIAFENVSISPPGSRRVVVKGATFSLEAGQGLGIIGPSASGKSSLVRALVGIWPCASGSVRIDGASLDQWTSNELGPHVGFLPQEVELFAGTIAENIARFEPDATSESIIAAAQAAGVHALILRLSEGYETAIGDGGIGLSAGQRQRVGLARALYRDPFMVVLDEPNANLDHEGENALTSAIMSVRERGGICVVVAHRPSALAALDTVMLISEGQIQAFGPKDDVLKRILKPTSQSDASEAESDRNRPRPTGQLRADGVPGALTLQESA